MKNPPMEKQGKHQWQMVQRGTGVRARTRKECTCGFAPSRKAEEKQHKWNTRER